MSDAENRGRRLVAWCKLLRLPNLLTIPGDTLAGFFLAALTTKATMANFYSALAAAAGVLCLYCMGLIFNDYFDIEEDRRDRPDRPLPSGQINPKLAAAVGVVFVLAGLTLAWLAAGATTLAIAGAITLLALIYDNRAKKIPVVGPIFMGACRGLSLLMGAAVLGENGITPTTLIAAGGLNAYIVTLSLIAMKETIADPRLKIKCIFPPLIIFVWLATLAWLNFDWLTASKVRTCVFGALSITVLASLLTVLRRACAGGNIPATIGWMIGLLIPLQAAQIALTGSVGPLHVCILLAMVAAWRGWFVLSRKFYGS